MSEIECGRERRAKRKWGRERKEAKQLDYNLIML